MFAVLMVPLSIQITLRRIALGNIAFGDANDKDIICKRETFRKYSEYVPLGLILLAVYEYKFGRSLSVWIFGGIFLFNRILHAIGLQYTASPKYFGTATVIQHSYFLMVGGLLIYKILL